MDSLDLARGIYAPGRAISGLTVRLVNKPNMLWRIFKVLSDFNVSILGTVIPTLTSEIGEVTLFLIIDPTNSSASLESIISELRRLDIVLDASIFTGEVEGGVFDIVHFPLKVHDVRCIILVEPALKGMVKTLRSELGLGGAVILFHIGSFIGVEVVKHYIERHGVKDFAGMFNLMKYLIAAWGWGIVVDARFDVEGGRGELNVKDLWECSLYSGLDSSQSHFLRGFLAGYLSSILNKSISVVEVKCIAKGDEYCKFIMEGK